jgi:hypothetical protein
MIVLLSLYAGLSWLHCEGKWLPATWLRWPDKHEHDQWGAILFMAWSCSFLYLLVLLYVKSRELPQAQGGAPFAFRYMISLVPLGIVAMTFFARAIVLAFRPLWVRAGLILLLTGLVVWRFYVAYKMVHYWIGI